MDLFELSKTITKKMDGDVDDFLDYAIIIRKWLDKNYGLHKEIEGNCNVSAYLALNDLRFKGLREKILKKVIHNKNKKPVEIVESKVEVIENRVEQIKEKQRLLLKEFMGGE